MGENAMDKKRRTRTILIIVVILLLLLAILLCRGCSGKGDTPTTDVVSTEAVPVETTMVGAPDGSSLVGRWDGSSSVLGDISIIIEKTAPVSDSDEHSLYVSGYVLFGEDPSVDPIAPLSGLASSTGEGLYEVQIWSTDLSPVIETDDIEDVQPPPILFIGSVDTGEGTAEGHWQTGEESGDWKMERGSELVPDSPTFDIEHSGLSLNFDVMAAVHTSGQNSNITDQSIQLEVTTNIALSEVLVRMPDGTEIVLERYTDLFSPSVDFINEFRFATGVEGTPTEGEYIFSFLDPMGEPLAGIEGVDVWGGCPAQAPLNVRATVGSNGIMLSWNQVPGFDPANPNWFYQIELALESGEGNSYGSNHIQQTSHLIPLASFMPGSAGSPDGHDHGVGLNQLGDGAYSLIVFVFVPADESSGLITHECQVMAEDEMLIVEKSGTTFTITNEPD